MTHEQKLELLTALAKLPPQELAKIQPYLDRMNAKALAKSGKPRGCAQRGWNLITSAPVANEVVKPGKVMEKRGSRVAVTPFGNRR